MEPRNLYILGSLTLYPVISLLNENVDATGFLPSFRSSWPLHRDNSDGIEITSLPLPQGLTY